jgi:MarR family transcriptional regulator, lower aerobic nicotinate degradation pathway regulator
MTVSDLETHIGYWLRYVSNHVSRAFAVKVEAKGVSVAEWVVMRELYDHESRSPSEIAARLGMTRGAITKIVDKLAKKRLVTRKQSRSDARYRRLALTRAGRALVPQLALLADQNDEEFFGQMKHAERKAIEDAMKEIIRRRSLSAVPVD